MTVLLELVESELAPTTRADVDSRGYDSTVRPRHPEMQGSTSPRQLWTRGTDR